jgi:hypothetical protein
VNSVTQRIKLASPFWYRVRKFTSDPRTLAAVIIALGGMLIRLQTKVTVLEHDFTVIQTLAPDDADVKVLRAQVVDLSARVDRIENSFHAEYLLAPKKDHKP